MGVPYHEQARRHAAAVRDRLRSKAGKSSKDLTLQLCDDVAKLADLVEASAHRPDYSELYAKLVEDYNAIWDGVRATLGIEVGQRHSGLWEWRWGVERGEATTPALALLAALKAAGAKRPPPPPLDAQLRAAGAAELPGISEAAPTAADAFDAVVPDGYAAERAAASGGPAREVHQ